MVGGCSRVRCWSDWCCRRLAAKRSCSAPISLVPARLIRLLDGQATAAEGGLSGLRILEKAIRKGLTPAWRFQSLWLVTVVGVMQEPSQRT